MRLNRSRVIRLFRQGLTIQQVCTECGIDYNGHTRRIISKMRPPDVVAKRGRPKRKRIRKTPLKGARVARRTPVPPEIARLRDELVAQWSKPYDAEQLGQLLIMLQAAIETHKPSVDARRRQV